MTTAFVFSGGGNRGACQIGMLRALTERGILPDVLVGTSIGAINAAFYAGTPTLEGTYMAAEVWRGIASQDVFPRGRLHGSWRFVERREAVFPLDGLRKVVSSLLRFERLEESPIPLTVVATRLDDGVEEWISQGPALDALLASAAIPGVFPVVELNGTRYVDGGVVNNAPLSVALASGAQRIYLLLCSDVNSQLDTHERPVEAMLDAFGLALRARLRRDLAAIPDDVDVIVFEQSALDEVMWQDFSHTDELIAHGYARTRAVLDEVEAELVLRDAAPPGRHGAVARRWSRGRLGTSPARRPSRARQPE